MPVGQSARQAVSRLDRAAQSTSVRTRTLVDKLQALDTKFSAHLQTAQSIFSEIQAAQSYFKQIENQVKQANAILPIIENKFHETSDIVSHLEHQLPEKREIIESMEEVYLLGRKRLQTLEYELQWLTMSYPWQIIKTAIFLQRPPRSERWIRNVRLSAYTILLCLIVGMASQLGIFDLSLTSTTTNHRPSTSPE